MDAVSFFIRHREFDEAMGLAKSGERFSILKADTKLQLAWADGHRLPFEAEHHATFKADDELQIVWGEVYVPGFPDSQGDFMTTTEVRKMAHSFMARGGSPDYGMKCTDIDHDGTIYKVAVVESFIARKDDPDFIPGAWVVGTYVEDPKVWAGIKKGEFNGFSMEALVYDKPCDLDVEFPDSIEGVTLKADADDPHTHVYKVMLDYAGQIIGGETNFVKGHRHMIKRGTITEEAEGHRHRFSFLDELDICA
jgi:Putative phage serine protease XkdF